MRRSAVRVVVGAIPPRHRHVLRRRVRDRCRGAARVAAADRRSRCSAGRPPSCSAPWRATSSTPRTWSARSTCAAAVPRGRRARRCRVRFRTSTGHFRACSVRARPHPRRRRDRHRCRARAARRPSADRRAPCPCDAVARQRGDGAGRGRGRAAGSRCAPPSWRRASIPLVWFGRPQRDADRSRRPSAPRPGRRSATSTRSPSPGARASWARPDGAGSADRSHAGARRHRLPTPPTSRGSRPRPPTASPARSRCRSGSMARSRACSGCTPRSRGPSTTWPSRCSRTSPPTSGSA